MTSIRVISIRPFRKREEGQDLLEYGMLASLIALFALAAIRLVGNQVGNVLWATIASSY
jgi:Flp pilus assembly pilin Flp